LNEIHNFYPDLKVDFAYSLAKGGIAIQTTSKKDRDFLLHNLPVESFGGGIKHPPRSNSASKALTPQQISLALLHISAVKELR